MKTTLILVLLLALAAAAVFTRPSESSFHRLVEEKTAHRAGGGIAGATLGMLAGDLSASQYTFQDHFLWVTVKKDGKTRYVGAFAHWFSK